MNTLHIKKWGGPDALECYQALHDEPYALFFDSNCPSHPLNKWSFICWNPIETVTAKNGMILHNSKTVDQKDLFTFLQSRLNMYDFNNKPSDIPFTGGFAGYFGYDLGRQLEKIPENTLDDINMPDMMVGLYTNLLAFDHQNNQAWSITTDSKEIQFLKEKLRQPQDIKTSNYDPDWQTSITDEDYCANIQRVIDDIHAGEVYQVNLSRRFEASTPQGFSRFAHYKKLRDINPAPFSAYLNFSEFQISSCSPEQFLNVENNIVETRPIKGTLDSSNPAQKLIKSAKDRAENTMIVDLLRNDLSKVCDYHSVKVPELCSLETFEGLHHLVSTVQGILKNNNKPTDLLRACFPGGSITGAPKIKAMHIIEELEPTRRGAYCGSIGMIGFHDTMNMSITIRTLIYANDKAYLQTGSGIVSDSDPQKELQESLDKASKIFESFESTETKEDAA